MAEPRVPNSTTSSPDPTPPPFTTIQEIELKIAQESKTASDTQAIINLKIERNTHAPVSRLPVEILCRIFEQAQQSCADDRIYRVGDGSLPGFHEGLSWIVVTHVCHYWRNAALNEPSLWTRPILQHAQWTSVFLERSRMAGLTLTFDNEVPYLDPERMTVVDSHLPRTTTLIITHMQRPATQKLFQHLSSTSALPMLTTLSLSALRAYNVILPENAMSGATSLRKISLCSITIPLTSPLFTRLTDLSLEYNDVQTVKPTPTEFLSMLQQNHTLRNLTLRDALPTASDLSGFSFTGPRIPLRHLKTLRIMSDALSCEFLFRNIASSGRMKQMKVMLKYELNSDRLFYKLLSALDEGKFEEPLRLRQATIRGEIRDRDRSNIAHPLIFLAAEKVHNTPLDMSDISPSLRGDSTVAPFEFSLAVPQRNQSAVDIGSAAVVVDFFDALHWENLSRLDLFLWSLRDPEFASILARTFGTLHGLRTVVVGESCANLLLDALLLNGRDINSASSPLPVTFPGLQHIHLSNVIFSKSSRRGVVSVDRLLDCLKDRQERGVKIHSLELKHCRMTKSDYELLGKVVPIIDTDIYLTERDYGKFAESEDDFDRPASD